MVEHFTRNEVVASSILASSSKSKSLVNAVISSMYKAFYISLIMGKSMTIGLIWHELAYEMLHPMLHLTLAVVEIRKNIIYNHYRTYIDDLWALCLI